MKKILSMVLCTTFIATASYALPLEDAVESCRISSTGLLPDVPGGNVYSSKVLVQEMRLRFLQGDRKKFASLYKLMKKRFQSKLMLLYRSLDSSLMPIAWESSVSTDLKACTLLIDVGEKWDVKEYIDSGLKAASRIRRFNVYRDVLVDGASWIERKSGIFEINDVSHVFKLKGIDTRALQKLRSLSSEWETVAQRSLGILLAGCSGGEIRKEYNIDKRRYEQRADSELDGLWITANLIEGGLLPVHALEGVLKCLAEDPRYFTCGDAASLQAASLGFQILNSTGHFALAQSLKAAIEEDFASESGLLCEPGKQPSIFDNLLWLSIREVWKGKGSIN